MAWGKPASERIKKIDSSRHLKLESVHPSPLSAARGFFDCRHFIKSNDWITTVHGVESVIDWTKLPPDGVSVGPPTKSDVALNKTSDKMTKGTNKVGMGEKEESFGISPEEESALLEVLDAPASRAE